MTSKVGLFVPKPYWRFTQSIVLYVESLFVCFRGFRPIEYFALIYRDVTITGEWFQILIYTRRSLLLISEGFIADHNYDDTGLLFIMVIYEDQ